MTADEQTRRRYRFTEDTLAVLSESCTEMLTRGELSVDLVLTDRKVAVARRRHPRRTPLTRKELLTWFGAIYIPLHNPSQTAIEEERLEAAADDLYGLAPSELKEELTVAAEVYERFAHLVQNDE